MTGPCDRWGTGKVVACCPVVMPVNLRYIEVRVLPIPCLVESCAS